MRGGLGGEGGGARFVCMCGCGCEWIWGDERCLAAEHRGGCMLVVCARLEAGACGWVGEWGGWWGGEGGGRGGEGEVDLGGSERACGCRSFSPPPSPPVLWQDWSLSLPLR